MKLSRRILALVLAQLLLTSALPFSAAASSEEAPAAEEDWTSEAFTTVDETECMTEAAMDSAAEASTEETQSPIISEEDAAEPPVTEAAEDTIPSETTSETEAAPAMDPGVETAADPSGSCGDSLTWTYTASSGRLRISGTGDMTNYGYHGTPWQEYSTAIKTVVIDSGVTGISTYAFSDCTALTSVSIPESVTRIGKNAFYDCTALTAITLPSQLTSIEPAVFYNCTALTKVVIPEGITSIGSYAFEKCTGLTSISIPSSVTSIGNSAFSNCTSLSGITLPSGLTTLGGGAFYGCTALATVALPSGLAVIQDHVFYGCTGLKEIVIPQGVTGIGYYAFGDCSYLDKISFAGSAPVIDDSAFYCVVATAYYPANDSSWTESILQSYGGDIEWRPISTEALAAPAKPYKIQNVISGIRVYWKSTSGASKYGVWRSSTGSSGSYSLIATTTATNYLDTSAQSGKTYHYKLTAIDHFGTHSSASPVVGYTFVSTPDFTLRVNRAVGIGLGWNKIEGATGYAVYRKTDTSLAGWVRVATITDPNTVTWNDTSVKNSNGTVYKYTVRALCGDNRNILSGCYGNGKTMVRLTSLAMSSAVKTGTNSIKCTWNTNSAATGYELRFIADDGIIQTYTIGNYRTGTKTVSLLRTGHQYQIQVRSYAKVTNVGSFYSAWSTPKYITL